MKYKIQKYDQELYSNVVGKYPLGINTFIQFPVTLKRSGSPRFFDLFFIRKDDKQEGSILISLTADGKLVKYNVPVASVVSDAPLRLTLEKPRVVSGDILVSIRYSADCETSLALWSNEKGPCAYVSGLIEKEVTLKRKPLISIITPTYNTNLEHFKETVRCVADQIYDNWEWCIVDDGSSSSKLKSLIRGLKDPRIKVRMNRKNAGIVKASNDALGMATGKFVSFLDHDDLIPPYALVEIASVLEKDPKIDMVYTDEDKLSSDGEYKAPFYKPDWNYRMLLNSMYTCHLSTYRKTILDKIGGFRVGFDGSQDYDLMLRFCEKTQRIAHIPEVLYHWRITEGSTAQAITNKPEARINAVRALKEHIAREGHPGRVFAGPFQGHYRVEYKITGSPHVSIIIPFRDKPECLKALFETIKDTEYPHYDILLVDNESKLLSTSRVVGQCKQAPSTRIVRYNKSFNFSKINNYAAQKCADSDLLLFLNNDIEIMHPEWLTEMVREFICEDVGIVGAKLLYLDHTLQHAGIIVGVNGVAGHSHKKLWDWNPGYFSRPHITQDVTAVTGACLMIRRSLFEELGGFEEDLPKAFNDIDLCLRAGEHGYSTVYTPYARLFHRESVSRGRDALSDPVFQEAIQFMQERWRVSEFRDPFYNPNLPDNCEGRQWI